MTNEPNLDERTHQLPKCRTIVRDRAHARAIAHLIPIGALFKNLGSPDGFGDWLFVNRTSFNGGNPLQQVRVYLNRSKHVSKRGEEFDATCRQEADRLEVIHNKVKERRRIQMEAELALIRECWGIPSIGIELIRAVLELGLGRGKHFSSSRDGKLRADVPPSLILRELLVLLERFDSLDIASGRRRAIPAEQEKQLRTFVARNGAWLIDVRSDVVRRMGPIGTNVHCVALCARALSRVPHIRTALRPLLTQTQMLEKIGAYDNSVSAGNAPPARRSRIF